jgi:hypothetical protein
MKSPQYWSDGVAALFQLGVEWYQPSTVVVARYRDELSYRWLVGDRLAAEEGGRVEMRNLEAEQYRKDSSWIGLD